MRSSAHLVSIFILVFFSLFLNRKWRGKNFIKNAVIGDSLVRGYGLVEKDGFVAKLRPD